MDHLFGELNLSSKPKTATNDGEGRAPIELLSKFLLAVQDREMKEALVMARELLDYEPDNKMIKEYHKYIQEYIAQGLDEEEEKDDVEESSEEEEGEESDGDHSGSSSSDEDEGKRPTIEESKKKEESKRGEVVRKGAESKRSEVLKKPAAPKR